MAKYSYSTDEETYWGEYATPEDAAEAAFEESDEDEDCDPKRTEVWVGESVPPTQPEDFWYAEDWLEHVSCQDDYSGEWAEDWDQSTKEQRAELEDAVRKVMAEWLDRHGLRPKHFSITKTRKMTRGGLAIAK